MVFREERKLAGAGKGKKHIVVFQDEEGNVLKTAFVSDGESVLPPDMPEKKGESIHHEIKFHGWDKDVSCIKENLVVKAVYREVPKEYIVMYFHENGKLLGTETVPYGRAAIQPYHPQKPQTEQFYYDFKGWNNDLSHIEKDTMAKAVFEEKTRSFAVRFFHEDGTLLKEESVLYGQTAQAPEQPEKRSDKMWHYIFDGWDRPFDNIKEETEIYAIFSSVYNEYRVCIYEQIESESDVREQQAKERFPKDIERISQEQSARFLYKLPDSQVYERLIEEKIYHYGEKVEYPFLKKKGYTLQWDVHPETVTKDIAIHGSWMFSNPVGKIFEEDGNRYQILNPSIKNGSVRLLHYIEDGRQIRIPEQIKIGDYYYYIERIAPKAFCGCTKMQVITLPDCVRVLEQKAFSYCKSLEKIILGRGGSSRLHTIECRAFEKNTHLKVICFQGRNLKKVDPEAFAGLESKLEVRVRPEEVGSINRLFQKGLKTGRIRIRTSKW